MSEQAESISSSIKSSNPKLQRTIERFRAKVANKDYYEAHQTLRSLISRASKSKQQVDHAIDLVYYGSLILIDAEQYASAADLVFYLVEMLKTHEIESTKPLVGKISTILTKFPAEELSFKKIDLEIIGWSCKYSEYHFGDPQLHDILGSKYLNVSKMLGEAPDALTENFRSAAHHLVLGTNHSYKPLVELIWDWYMDSQTPDDLAYLVSFPVVNYLILKNIKAAKLFVDDFFRLFYKQFTVETLPYKDVKADDFFKIYMFDHLPILNFLQLVTLTIQTNNKDLFLKLKSAYAADIKDTDLTAAVNKIGSLYFNIQVQKQMNFLQQMMGGF